MVYMMNEKTYTVKLTDSELNLIYDALEEFRISCEPEDDEVDLDALQDKLFETTKDQK